MPICQPRCMTPWDSMRHVEHKKTSSHIQPQLHCCISCLPRPRKDSDGDSALQDWRDGGNRHLMQTWKIFSVQPVVDGKKPISEALVLCLGSYLPKSLLKSESYARFQDWLSSLAEQNFSKAPGVGLHFWESLPRSGRRWAHGGNDNVACSGYDICFGWIFHDIPRSSSWKNSEF